MRRIAAGLALAGILAGCGPQMGWKGSASRTQYDADHAGCRAEAAAQFPPAFNRRQTPLVVIGGTQRPAYVSGTGRDSFDAAYDLNRAPRSDAYDACMVARGYRWGQIGSR